MKRQTKNPQHTIVKHVHHALRQVRVFAAGTDDEPLPDEHAVLSAMRAAVTEV
jgi:hypothetical protein